MMHLGVHLRTDEAVKLTGHLKVFIQLYRADLNNFKGKMRNGALDSILDQIQCSSS